MPQPHLQQYLECEAIGWLAGLGGACGVGFLLQGDRAMHSILSSNSLLEHHNNISYRSNGQPHLQQYLECEAPVDEPLLLEL
jgi:hypothetical protein